MESNINKLEREIKEMDVALAANYDATVAKPDFFDTYNKKKKDIESYMKDWEDITEQLDGLD